MENKMKHYVIINHWALDEEIEIRIVGVAHTANEAQAIFDTALAEEKRFAKGRGWDCEESNSTSYTAYQEGFYTEGHTSLYIQEIEGDTNK